MALPPIISNTFVKLFRTEQSNKAANTSEEIKNPQQPQDVVEISQSARQRLDGTKEIASAQDAKDTATDTRAILESTGFSLGLNAELLN